MEKENISPTGWFNFYRNIREKSWPIRPALRMDALEQSFCLYALRTKIYGLLGRERRSLYLDEVSMYQQIRIPTGHVVQDLAIHSEWCNCIAGVWS